MSRRVIFLMALLALSCAEKLIEAPEDLIAKDKMADILNDIAILNAARTTNYGKMSRSGVQTMDFIYNKYGIDSAQFVRSDRYYASRPVEYESIYSIVEARLELESKRWKEIKRAKDSLRENRKDSLRSKNLRIEPVKKDSLNTGQP